MKKLLLMAVALLTFGAATAQSEVIAKYNEAATAMQSKNFAGAAQLFEQVIDKGVDSEDPKVLSCVTTAKKYLPVCYQRVGIAAASQKNFPKAIEQLQKAAEIAELYGNSTEKNKSNTILAKNIRCRAVRRSTPRTTRRLPRYLPRVTPPIRVTQRWPSTLR